MKNTLTLLGLLLATLVARADIILAPSWNSGFANGGSVPDGNTTGWFDTRAISGYSGYTISDVNVTLNLGGGYNGDLYGYLVHDSGFAVLLNRMGVGVTSPLDAFGSPAAGLNVRFSDGAANGDIHTYTGGTTLTGLWQADGRNLNPQSSAAALEGAARQNGGNPLGLFNGLNPNGNWTLFLADVTGGDQSAVNNWGLELTLTAVPEATQWMATAVMFAIAGIYAYRVRRQVLQEHEVKARAQLPARTDPTTKAS